MTLITVEPWPDRESLVLYGERRRLRRRFLNRSRLPLLRRISQIFFLLLFLWLLLFTSLNLFIGGATEIQLRAPVRLFFEWDPLVAVVNALAGHALYRGLIWSLVILVPALFLGRFFCGWICPMGTLQHFVGNMPSEAKRGKQRIESNRNKRWQTVKYVVLIAGLVAACFGSAAIGWIDPFSLLVRSFGLSILPAFNAAARAALTPLETSHFGAIKATGQALHTILHYTVLDLRQPHYAQGLILGILFIAILALSLRITRFWCRAICPLGALLGAVSRWSILGLSKDAAACDKCNRCLLDCQGGDDPIGGVPWRKSECLMCMNCVGSCPHDSLKFKFFRPKLGRDAEVASPNLGRRRALTGLAAGAAIVPLMRANPGLGKGRHERLLRPPGSLDEQEFLSRCIPHWKRPDWRDCGRRHWCRASATASRVACSVRRSAQPAPSGRSRRRKRAGWWVWASRASRSAWGRHSMTGAAACRGPWLPSASSAKSGARFRPKLFMSKRRRSSTPPAMSRHSSSRASIQAVAWVAARASMPARCRSIRLFTLPALARAVRRGVRFC